MAADQHLQRRTRGTTSGHKRGGTGSVGSSGEVGTRWEEAESEAQENGGSIWGFGEVEDCEFMARVRCIWG